MPRGGQNAIPEAELIDALRELADMLGRSPSQSDINEHSPHSHKTYYRKFDGGLAEAKERAGVEHYTAPQDVERVTVECAQCGTEIERPPSDVENTGYQFCSQDCHYEHNRERYRGENNPVWNSREVECATCGETFYQHEYWIENRENLFCDRECYGKWRSENVVGEDHPRWKDDVNLSCDFCGRIYSVKPSEEERSRFCSMECHASHKFPAGEDHPTWNSQEIECEICGKTFYRKKSWIDRRKAQLCSVECFGKWRSENVVGENHPRHKGDVPSKHHPDYLGPHWEEERTEALIRDQARCRECGMPEHVHLELFGYGLHVHHLTERRRFVEDGKFNHAEANQLDNLKTLCCKHHGGR